MGPAVADLGDEAGVELHGNVRTEDASAKDTGGMESGVVTPVDMLSFARQVAMAMVRQHTHFRRFSRFRHC